MSELLSEFLCHESESLAHLIGRGVLPAKGKLVLGGAAKANKSFVALNIMLSLARGHPIFDARYKNGTPILPVSQAYRVLYIEQEIGDNGLRERFKGVNGHGGLIQPDDINLEFFVKTKDTAMRLDTPEGREYIAQEVELVKPHVVWLDPLAKFHLSDENSAQEMGAVMRISDHLIEKFGCAVCINHHTGHENPEYPRRGGDRLRGSTAVYADADTIITVQRLGSASVREPVLRLDFELRRGEPIQPLYIRRLASGQCLYLGDDWKPEAPKRIESAQRIPYKDL